MTTLAPSTFTSPVDATTASVVPVCLIGDVSLSMNGPSLDAVNLGFATLISTLKLHPEAADTAFVQFIKFSDRAQIVMPYTHVTDATTPPTLTAEGGTSYGSALSLARREMESMVTSQKAANVTVYRPTIYMITDGAPTDPGWEAELDALATSPFAPNICVFGVAGADAGVLRTIARRDRGQVWLADQGADPAVSFANLFPALVRTVMQSATALAAGQPVPAPIPVAVPGMTALDAI